MVNHYLGIETSSTNCSVGIFQNTELIDFIEINDGYSHGEVLAKSLDTLLKRQNLAIKDVKAIGIGKGPGSYTGLRIGVAFAKGLAFSNQIKLIAIDSLKNMALQVIQKNSREITKEDLLISLIDARRDEVYLQMFSGYGTSISRTEALVIDNSSFAESIAYEKVYCFGSGSKKLTMLNETSRRFKHSSDIFPSVKGMASVIHSNYLGGIFEDLAYFEPFYLKEFIAGKPKTNHLIP